MSIVSLSALITALGVIVTSAMERTPVSGLIFLTSLLLYSCLGTMALVRREFYCQERTPRRWRQYAAWGSSLGFAVVVYHFMTLFRDSSPVPFRVMAFAFASAVVLLTAAAIVRYYMLPLSLAVQAAFRMRQEDQGKLIKRLTQGDPRLADEVSQALDMALNDDKN